jgi:hypothetical protein
MLHVWEKRNPKKNLQENLKRPVGRSRSRWEDIKMDHKDVGLESVYRISLLV